MTSNIIEKIRYNRWFFDVRLMAVGRKEVYTLYPNGRVVCSYYKAGSRQCVKKAEFTAATEQDFRLLCKNLSYCIATADRENQYVDDTGGEIKLYRSFGRVDTMPRGYGNAAQDVGRIVSAYLCDIANIDDKI